MHKFGTDTSFVKKILIFIWHLANYMSLGIKIFQGEVLTLFCSFHSKQECQQFFSWKFTKFLKQWNNERKGNTWHNKIWGVPLSHHQKKDVGSQGKHISECWQRNSSKKLRSIIRIHNHIPTKRVRSIMFEYIFFGLNIQMINLND